MGGPVGQQLVRRCRLYEVVAADTSLVQRLGYVDAGLLERILEDVAVVSAEAGVGSVLNLLLKSVVD